MAPRGSNASAVSISSARGCFAAGRPALPPPRSEALQGFVGYQIDPYTKFTADYYHIPFFPLGASGTSVPLLIRGSSTPVGSVALPQSAPNSDVYKFLNLGLQQTFIIAKRQPLIVTPGYIFPVFQYDDAVTIEGNGQALSIKIRS